MITRGSDALTSNRKATASLLLTEPCGPLGPPTPGTEHQLKNESDAAWIFTFLEFTTSSSPQPDCQYLFSYYVNETMLFPANRQKIAHCFFGRNKITSHYNY